MRRALYHCATTAALVWDNLKIASNDNYVNAWLKALVYFCLSLCLRKNCTWTAKVHSLALVTRKYKSQKSLNKLECFCSQLKKNWASVVAMRQSAQRVGSNPFVCLASLALPSLSLSLSIVLILLVQHYWISRKICFAVLLGAKKTWSAQNLWV